MKLSNRQGALFSRIRQIWESAQTQAARVESGTTLKQHAVRGESPAAASWQPGRLNPPLSWTHYRVLLKVERRELRAEIQRELGRIEESAAYAPALVTRKKRAPPRAARTAKPAKPQSARTRSRGKGDAQ